MEFPASKFAANSAQISCADRFLESRVCVLLRVCWIKKCKEISLDKMADRVTSAVCCFSLIFYLFLLINCNCGERFGDRATSLHISEDTENTRIKKSVIIERNDEIHDDDETSFMRKRRDATDATTSNESKIVAKVSILSYCWLKLNPRLSNSASTSLELSPIALFRRNTICIFILLQMFLPIIFLSYHSYCRD